MPIDVIALAPLQRRRHEGPTFEDVAHMADRHSIENAMHRRFIVFTALIEPLDAAAFAGGCGHVLFFRLRAIQA